MITPDSERRNFHRMMIDSPVEVSNETCKITGVCRNLSATGMLLYLSDASFQVGDMVSINLPPGDNRIPPLKAEAKVMRMDEVDNGFLMGVEFVVMH